MAERGRDIQLSDLTSITTSPPHSPAPQVHTYKLSVFSKLCYAVGGAPNQVAGSASAFFLQIYLLDIAQITPFEASLVLFVGKSWGGITDPIVGFFINKSKWTRIGRLMPWMVGCMPFLVVSYFFLWFVPPFVTGRFLWYLTFYCSFQALTTVFHVPYATLTMFLITDQAERDSATAYRMTVEVLGTLIGAAVQGQIVASAHTAPHCILSNGTANLTADATDSWADSTMPPRSLDFQRHARNVYMLAAGVIGSLYLICTAVFFAGVKERDDPYALHSGKVIPFFKGFKMSIRHGPYLNLIASFLLISAAVQLMIPFAIMLVTIANLIIAYMVAVSSGISIAASLLLPWSMLPDVVDNFRLMNHHSKGLETIFYSSYVFFTRLSSGIALGISTLSLQFAGYSSGACKQSYEVVLTLKILVGAVPAVLIISGLFILLFYPITEDKRQETELTLGVMRYRCRFQKGPQYHHLDLSRRVPPFSYCPSSSSSLTIPLASVVA
ncbi:sphingosine-1-phosphate transporter MFSD2B isoform X6 [Ascaphus truei]|uniref:sphingosine-1-phosphate transporter MFSD2B isoform X6 n=1 Tax=Ascaphus truei TaxID=8439 RepID=UPI003F5A3114